MGSCTSIHKHTDSDSKVGVSIVSETKNLLVSLPTEPKTINVEHPISDFGVVSRLSTTSSLQTPHDFASREDTFFDSRPWLDSDCEDFYSTKGDFTPSCGSSRSSTPMHMRSYMGTPQRNKAFLIEKTSSFEPEKTPPKKRKKLAELFRESFNARKLFESQNIEGKENVANQTSFLSSSERTPNRVPKPEKVKFRNTVRRCLPSLIPSCSSIERKERLSMSSIQNGERMRA